VAHACRSWKQTTTSISARSSVPAAREDADVNDFAAVRASALAAGSPHRELLQERFAANGPQAVVDAS